MPYRTVVRSVGAFGTESPTTKWSPSRCRLPSAEYGLPNCGGRIATSRHDHYFIVISRIKRSDIFYICIFIIISTENKYGFITLIGNRTDWNTLETAVIFD